MNSALRISVIIPALNEADRIERAVETAWSAGADEVIVADGGSDDASLDLLRQLRCTVVESTAGRATQQNCGAREAQGDVLVFLHADNRLAERALDQVREACADPRVLCGAFRQRINHRSWKYRCLEWGNNRRVRWFGIAYGDQGIFVRLDVFQRLGGFPEVPLLEDVLLMKQLRKLARPVLLPGPLLVDARRWEKHGVIRQTLRNWWILTAHRFGASPQRLARLYRRHDKGK